MVLSGWSVVTFFAFTFITTSVGIAGEVSFQGLCGFGTGYDSIAHGVSADGSVIVGERDAPPDGTFRHEFIWSSGTVKLQFSNSIPGSYDRVAMDVSDDGLVVTGQHISEAGIEAFLWTQTSGVVGLGHLPQDGYRTQANAISADGQVIVGKSSVTYPGSNVIWGDKAFRWTAETGMVEIGKLPGGYLYSSANGVSADGSVVVGVGQSSPGSQAFRWTLASGIIGLGDLPGGKFSSQAYDVSADGSVIVGRGNSSSGYEAFRWTEDTGMIGLGRLMAGNYDSQANAISADGSIIVGYSKTHYGQKAFIWDEENGMRNLQDVLTHQFGLDLTGWILFDATGISADGNTIIGYGRSPRGYHEAFRAVIPEPGMAAMFAVGLSCLLRRGG